MWEKLGHVILAPWRLLAETTIVGGKVIRLCLPIRRAQRRHTDELERQRRELNQRTESALSKAPDFASSLSSPVLVELRNVYDAQFVLQSDIAQMLKEKSIDREQGLRAGATAVLFQLVVLLRSAELRCLHYGYDGADADFNDTLGFANSNLDEAAECITLVERTYLAPLLSRAMRRDRLARRIFWLLTLKSKGQFDRDAGFHDILQELRGLENLLNEERAGLRIFANDYFTEQLRRAAVDFANEDDVQILQKIRDIVDRVVALNSQPADENYPLLIKRLVAIRPALLELPVWDWSLKWQAYSAILQSWLYVFACTGAQACGDRESAKELYLQARDLFSQVNVLMRDIDRVRRGLRPLWARFGMIGRQRQIAGFGPPPSMEQLQQLLDVLRARLRDQRRSF